MKPVGVANRNRYLADADVFRVPQLNGAQLRRKHANHGQVGIRVVADHVRIRTPAIGERDLDALRTMDDVAVR